MHRQKIRFVVVGILNTAVDTAVFFVLRTLGVSLPISVVISSSCGLTTSYLLNKHFTFNTRGGASIVRFLAVTLTGLWVLQPLIITGLEHSIAVATPAVELVYKLVATGFTMVWNYLWYKHVVFVGRPKAVAAESSSDS